jgi:hypothetical protein
MNRVWRQTSWERASNVNIALEVCAQREQKNVNNTHSCYNLRSSSTRTANKKNSLKAGENLLVLLIYLLLFKCSAI